MAKWGHIVLNGKSGEKYRFQIWPLETKFKPIGAVFFLTERTIKNKNYDRASHSGVYIGQTENLSDPFSTHPQLDCFKKHRANCICIFPVADEEKRVAVEQDLISEYRTSCND